MYLAKDLDKFPDEANLVGRILVSYANLEIDLMNCVKVANDNLDTALKTMFRSRGETQRIQVADALGRQQFKDIGLTTEFEMAIGAMNICKNIRNQYAHCNWWDDLTGKLAFASLEEISKSNDCITDLSGLTTKHVDVALLTKQFEFFEYTSDLFIWLINRYNELEGKPFHPGVSKPKHLKNPKLYI
jgi:hypothetical protein